jgi:hypothetical protein
MPLMICYVETSGIVFESSKSQLHKYIHSYVVESVGYISRICRRRCP